MNSQDMVGKWVIMNYSDLGPTKVLVVGVESDGMLRVILPAAIQRDNPRLVTEVHGEAAPASL